MMRKLLTLTLAVLLVGLFAAVVFAAVESGDGSSSTTFGTTNTAGTTETTETTETTTTPGDISGPCDEAENRNDPRCAGVAVPPAQGAAPVAPQGGVDISGPCDEPEHFGDPRCIGGVDDHRGGGGDNSGPGPGGDDSGHGFDDNSGPGGGGDPGRGRGRGRGGDDD
jgi:hypothetical protein